MRKRMNNVVRRREMGLCMFSAGCGMLIVIIVPWWGFFAAALLVIVGAWLLFSGPSCK